MYNMNTQKGERERNGKGREGKGREGKGREKEREKERKERLEKLFEVIMAKSFPKLMTNNKSQILGAQRTASRVNDNKNLYTLLVSIQLATASFKMK